MTASAPLDEAWNYPLFEALYGRRSRRFGLGFEMQEGPFRYKSAHAPVPLTELEEALLVGAGAGFTGLAFWDLPTPAPYPHRSGRTFPTTRGASGNTALFFTNDDGFYVLDDKVAAEKLREVETTKERSKLLDVYRTQRRTLKPGRLDIPRRVPPMSGHDLWDSNRPGSTLFLPVCDVSASLITLIAQFVDPALRRYAPASGGMNIVDDRRGFRPAGTEHWVKGGFLNAEKVLPVSIIERQACYYVFSEPAAICQNMFLATEALGLGGWKRCGFLSLEIFQRMGFRIVATEGGRDSAIRSGLTVCSRQVARPIIRPWMRRLMRFLREPRARRRHPCRIACQTRTIAPAPSVLAPKGSPAPKRSVTTSTTPTGAFLAPSMRCI